MKMVNGKILVTLLSEDLSEHDGIIYTSEQRHKSFRGEVKATDPSTPFKVGEVVVFSEFAGENIWIDGEKFMIIDSENIWGVM
ncbi:MAG: hypothetical protein EHM49_01805 [Deltaproteobacteria bacterium]|nr:MAG: hypothetical protein EHM49_06300 [Deltaproteobacteria bacterium]RPI55536.1 MAG: hypothetical protein EHM49_01805 [Deltaproteobacteria bacterium]